MLQIMSVPIFFPTKQAINVHRKTYFFASLVLLMH
jgi:hypothetical protein